MGDKVRRQTGIATRQDRTRYWTESDTGQDAARDIGRHKPYAARDSVRHGQDTARDRMRVETEQDRDRA